MKIKLYDIELDAYYSFGVLHFTCPNCDGISNLSFYNIFDRKAKCEHCKIKLDIVR